MKPAQTDTGQQRIVALLEYDGAAFHGWQLQEGVRTVQQVVEQAFSRVADHELRVITAGRTDTGVHACAQVIHFDSSAPRSERSWLRGANANLPGDVAIRWVGRRDQEFHARFRATGRRYRYVILNRPQRPGLVRGRVTWDYRPLDVALMQQAAAGLLGRHDFSSYRAVQCQAKSPIRELRQLEVSRRGDFIFVDAYADAFLHHMVRNLAGVLMSIGAGEHSPDWARQILQARDRTLGGVTAPPDGLYLTEVEYPEVFDIPCLPPHCGLW